MILLLFAVNNVTLIHEDNNIVSELTYCECNNAKIVSDA